MPALFALFGEIAGIFSFISVFNRNFLVLCIIFLFVLFLLLIVDKRYYVYIILFFILGIFTTTLAIAPFKNPEIPEHLCGVRTQITGKVKEFSKGAGYTKNFEISHLSIEGEKFAGSARVYAETAPAPFSTVVVKGVISKNSSQNNFQKFTGCSYTIFSEDVSVTRSFAPFDFFTDLRDTIEDRILLSMKSEEAFLFLSSVPGISSMTKDEKLPFIDTGTAHLFAISGLHFGILGETSYRALALFTPFAYEFSFVILAFFLFLVGFRVSALRAFFMYGACVIAKATGKELIPLNTLSFAALIILLVTPFALFSVSFQLSFLAIFAILIIAPLFYQHFPQNFGFKMLAAVISVQLLLFPLFAYYFHNVSLVAVMANFIVIPFLYLLMPISLIQLVLTVISFRLALLFAPVTNFFFSVLLSLVKMFSKVPFASLNIQFNGYFVAAYFAVISLLIFSYTTKKTWRKLVFIPLILLVAASIFVRPGFCITPLQLSGEDGFIVQSGNDVVYISSPTYLTSEDKDLYSIQLALKERGINKIDLMVFNAPFKQRESSSVQLVEQFSVKSIVLPKVESELQKAFIALNAGKIQIYTISDADKIHFKGMTFRLVQGTGDNYSVVLEHEGRTFLLAGRQFKFDNSSFYADVAYFPLGLLERLKNAQLRFGEIHGY
ncbi:MAG: ComEC/Rec2 family competence protein [Caldisericaceae bacterium]|nr:ComEC/Rec2 family competence protein [Caldisericaceae bacterium]